MRGIYRGEMMREGWWKVRWRERTMEGVMQREDGGRCNFGRG